MAERVGLAGDWHGHLLWAEARIRDLSDKGITVLLHQGDFGLWTGPTGAKFLRRLDRLCAERGVRIYVTPGNHEDWSRLVGPHAKKPVERDEFGAVQWMTDRIAFIPTGHRFTLGGRSFVSLGGAPSLDFESRTEGRSWWPEEMITREVAAQVAADGYADVMLCHDAPDHPWQTPRVAHIVSTNPFGWSAPALSYAAEGRQRITQAFLGVRPRLLVHGHYHCASRAAVDLPDSDHRCDIVSLHCNGRAGNIAVLDLETLAVE